ncbi:MAG: methyl-accepting chemotaxis protein [Firmicutes bacterium]|nr:methyl-accepting chemotaxis protein [Bacillota bacterium]
MKLFQSIRSQLLVWVLFLFFIALVVQSAVSFIGSRGILENQIKQACQVQATDAAGEIDTWVDGRFKELETIAKISAINSMKTEGLAELLAQIKSDDKEALYVAWPDGTYISNKGLQTVLLNDRDYFQKAMAGKANIGSPIISRTTGNVVAPIAIPIYRNNKVEGVLAATIKTENLINIVNSIKVGQEGYAFMVDKDGTFVAHRQKEYIFNKKLADVEPGLAAMVPKMANQETNIEQCTIDGVEKLAVYTPVSSTGWSLLVNIPVKETTQPLNTMLRNSIFVTLATLILMSILIYLVSGKFSKPIVDMTEITTRLSQRDLSQKISSDNATELGVLMRSLGVMNESLRGIFQQIAGDSESISKVSRRLLETANETNKASSQVSASAEEVARAATSQAQDVGRTSELAQQVMMAMHNVGSNTEKISFQSVKFKEIVDRVTSLVDQQDQKMKRTVQSTISVSNLISDLNHKTRAIVEIIQVIDSIASQTNLLALNAAIEAARAGESGRGFAVVAEEVRKLAEETSQATLNIGTIIGEVQKQVDSVVGEVKIVEKMVREQGDSLEESASAFGEIESGAGTIDGSIQDISATFEELVASADEITRAIENISAATQESAAAAEEVTAISQYQLSSVNGVINICSELENLARNLRAIVETFKFEE